MADVLNSGETRAFSVGAAQMLRVTPRGGTTGSNGTVTPENGSAVSVLGASLSFYPEVATAYSVACTDGRLEVDIEDADDRLMLAPGAVSDGSLSSLNIGDGRTQSVATANQMEMVSALDNARMPAPGSAMASMTMDEFNVRLRRIFSGGSRTPALAPTQPPAHGLGLSANAYATCVRSPYNGKVYFAPQDADTIGVWDPVANTWSTLNPVAYGLTAFTNSAFGTCCATDDGLVVFPPYGHTHFVVLDLKTNTMYETAHGLGAINAFSGCALASDNATLVCAPFAATAVGLFNIRTRIFTSGVTHGEGSTAFECAFWVPGDEFIFAPLGAGEVARYRLAQNDLIKTGAHGQGANAFQGVVPLTTGKYFLVPFSATVGGLVDPKFTAGTGYSSTSAHGVAGGLAFCGGGLMADGRVLLYPRRAANYIIYDPFANSWTTGPAHGAGGTDAFIGGCMLPGGQHVLAPMDAAGANLIDTFAAPVMDQDVVSSSLWQRY